MKKVLFCIVVLVFALGCFAVAEEQLPSGVLMTDVPRSVNMQLDKSVLGRRVSREDVKTISFSDDLSEAPARAWDVSANRDRSVLAWISEGASPYELTIAAEGGVYANPDSTSLFEHYYNLENIYFNGCFDTSLCTNMDFMFRCCKSLKELDLSGFDTSNVTSMEKLFEDCESLIELDMTPLDTSAVTNMLAIFADCVSLQSLNISTMDTSSAENMAWMFGKCKSLTELDVSNLDTSSAVKIYAMFEECESLRTLDLTNFDTSRAERMHEMFSSCTSLESVDLSSFDTSSVTNMFFMFYDCPRLTELDLTSFDTAQVSDFTHMFKDSPQLQRILVSDRFVVNDDAENEDMFTGTPAKLVAVEGGSRAQSLTRLTNVLMSDVPSDEDIEGGGGYVLGSDISRWAIGSITFVDDLSNAPDTAWDVSELNNGAVLAWVEEGGYLLDLYIGADGGVTANPNSSYLFHGYLMLQEIQFNGCFDTSLVTKMANMFAWDACLMELDLSEFDTGNVWDMGSMFLSCVNLRSLDLTGFDTSGTWDMTGMFLGCTNLAEIDVSSFDTSEVISMFGMFGATGLTRLDLTNFDTANVVQMGCMFYNCDALAEVLVSDLFIIGDETITEDMFKNCPAGAVTVA